MNWLKAHWNIEKGWELHSKVVVDKITIGTPTSRLLVATGALALLDPPREGGTSHPDWATAILEDITPEAIGPHSVTLDLLYRDVFGPGTEPNKGGIIEVGSSLVQEVTNKDHTGKAIIISYKGIPDNPTVSVPRAQTTLQVKRSESTCPAQRSRTYVGTMSQAGWLVDPGAAAHEWLCTQYRGTTTNSGKSYACQLGFQYKKGGWDQLVVAIDPKTGKVYQDVFKADGSINIFSAVLLVQVCDDCDFNSAFNIL